MMKTYTPELRQKVMALSPELKGTIQKLHAGHTRRAKETNLRQIMHEILSEYQSIASALATDNAEQAAEAAGAWQPPYSQGRTAGLFPAGQGQHQRPVGAAGDEHIVEGSALKLAEAADAGDMPKAASYMSDIMTGCVACHQKFRGVPGISANLMTPAVQVTPNTQSEEK